MSSGESSPRTISVPPERIVRWFENFSRRHGGSSVERRDGALVAAAADGAVASAALPFGRPFTGADVDDLAASAVSPVRWGLLLVRKGGFAVAAGTSGVAAVSKVGQRHVQGRTKAGGQSQQRFARRRDNQARQAYEAAADHAHRVLVVEFGDIEALVCGGDRSAVDAVLADPRLTHLTARRTQPWLPVADPRRDVLNQAIVDARSVRITLTEP